MDNLIGYAKQVITKYPQLKEKIHGLIDLCVMEIEEGGSETHEIELCRTDIKNLVVEEDKWS